MSVAEAYKVGKVMDTCWRTPEMTWVEYMPGAEIKVLRTSPETGQYSVLLRWKKGFVAPPHKHLSASHAYIISGSLKVRDEVLLAGDYVYEPNRAVHGATTALEDTVYLMVCEGPLLMEGENDLTGASVILGCEEVELMRPPAN